MPETKAVLRAVGLALARMRTPTLDAFAGNEISAAMTALVDANGPNPALLKVLMDSIRITSDGLVHVEPVTAARYPARSSAEPALYLRVWNPYRMRYVMLGNFAPPVTVTEGACWETPRRPMSGTLPP